MKKENIKFALFIPTYNVSAYIVSVLQRIPDRIYEKAEHIYIFDNQSTDKTVAVVQEYIKSNNKHKILLFQNNENYLLGGSTVLAFDRATKENIDYLICMHSDGQADPHFLLEFEEYLPGDYDFILGSRFLKESQVEEYSQLRYIFNMLFVYLQWLILRQKVFDIGAFIAFKIETVREIPYKKISADMGYHPYLIMVTSQLLKRRLKFKEFPISWGKVEESNVNVVKYGLVHLLRILMLLFGRVSYKEKDYKAKKIDF